MSLREAIDTAARGQEVPAAVLEGAFGEIMDGEATPVGTFESGRRAGSDTPYDLVGNVREWSESVPASWCEQDLEVPASFARCHERALATPALGVWRGTGGQPTLM